MSNEKTKKIDESRRSVDRGRIMPWGLPGALRRRKNAPPKMPLAGTVEWPTEDALREFLLPPCRSDSETCEYRQHFILVEVMAAAFQQS